jgi:hypothetical protein
VNTFHSALAIVLWCVVLAGNISSVWPEEQVNHSLYGELLAKYVKSGVVDYGGFKSEEGVLDNYLELLENTDPNNLSSEEQFALYINAYNAYTIKLILTHYPGIESIKDIGGFWRRPWKIRFCKIGGEVLTLDEIEHEILRPRFNDPRVHFAINCAAKGCPPLSSTPYRGSTLEQHLDMSTRAFINNSEQNRLQGNTLYVSRIFKWFKNDFRGGVEQFFLQYAQGDLREKLVNKKDQIEVKYLSYDWSLNGN